MKRSELVLTAMVAVVFCALAWTSTGQAFNSVRAEINLSEEKITDFRVPAAYNILTVPILAFTVINNNEITGYLLKESQQTPEASDPGWSSTIPVNYTFAAAGTKTLYAWVKDGSGNVSTSKSASVVVNKGHFPSPLLTDRTSDFIGTLKINGRPPHTGDEVAFFNPQGIICGLFVVTDSTEYYGIMSAYGDDPTTSLIVEGAKESDILTVKVWYATAGLELAGESVILTAGDPLGSFSSSLLPPLWHENSGFVLNIEGKTHFSEPLLTPLVSSFLGNVIIEGNNAEAGDEIAVFDSSGVLCGHFIVTAPGKYGIMQVYGDDTTTSSVDEGARAGEILTFKIWVRRTGIEYSGNQVGLSPGVPVGSFLASSIPPVWQENNGSVLNLVALEDATPPEVKTFSIPTTSTSLNVSISEFIAIDNIGVVGYLVTESATAPTASDAGWSATAPASYTFTTDGAKTLYAWVKDVAGNVSAGESATVTITLTDPTAPTVTEFSIPLTSAALTVTVISFVATDNIGVTGYMLSETSTAPASSDPGWSAVAPASYTFNTDGTKTLYAWAKDAAGNIAASLSAAVTIDTTAPEVTLNSKPAGLTNVTMASFSFSANEAGAAFQCQLDSRSYESCASPASYTNLAEGSHSFNVKATDLAGNTGAPAGYSWQIDATVPSLTDFVVPQLTNLLTVSITKLMANDNTGVTGYLVTELSTTPQAGDAGWSATPPANYTFATEGVKTLYTWAKDAAGNVSNSLSASVTVDAAAPTVTVFMLPATSSTLTVTITTFTATDNQGVTGYLVTESSTAPGADDTNWSATAPAVYVFTKEGTKTLYAWARDAVGNVSAGRSASVNVALPDTTAPTVSAFSIPATTNNLSVSLSNFTATDNVGVTGYMVTESANAPGAEDTRWSASAPSGYIFTTDGSKMLYAWAKDAAGNVSAGLSASVNIDATAPTVTAFSLPSASNTLTVTITTLTATDNIGVTGYLVTESSTAPSANDTNWNATIPVNYTFTSEGTKTLYAWARDEVGNVSAGRSASLTVDMAAPDVTIGSKPVNPTTMTNASFSFSAGETGATFQCQLDGGSFVSCSSPATYSNLTEGSHTFDVKATDLAGNTGAAAGYSWQIDLTGPSVTDFSVPPLSSMLTVAVTKLIATDNTGVTGYLITEFSTAPQAGDTGWSTTPPATYTFTTDGAKTLYAWAKDGTGNVSNSLSASVTVDSTAPTVTAFSLPATSNTLMVTITILSATDNQGVTGYLVTESSTAPNAGDSKWSATTPANYTFTTEGNKTLYAWAKDAVGNVSGSLSATVDVHIALPVFTVTPSAGSSGTISPSTAQIIELGSTASFTMTPDSGHTVSDNSIGGTCPQGELNDSTYTTGAITSDCTVIVAFPAKANITPQIATSRSSTVALKSDGSAWSWGWGPTESTITPVQIGGLGVITAIAAGELCEAFLKSDGTVWALGDWSCVSPVLYAYGLSGVTAIAEGYSNTVALKSDGTVWASNYQQGVLSGLSGITAIAAAGGMGGSEHTLGLKNDGTVWAWGNNEYGQLGNGTTTSSYTPVRVSGLREVTAIAAGAYHSVAIKKDGSLWAWGHNSTGQLGNGTTTSSSIPVQVKDISEVTAVAAGYYNTVALKSDGTVWSWGSNYWGEVGNGTRGDVNYTTPVQVNDLVGVTAIAAGEDFAVALKSDGSLWSWGHNVQGRLGNGEAGGDIYSATPVQVMLASGEYFNALAPTETYLSIMAGLGGTVSPSTEQIINFGSSAVFIINSDNDHALAANSIGGSCPQGTFNGNIYTTGIILKDCEVIVSFAKKPLVTAFSLPVAANTLTVAITALTATSSQGVTAYMVTESSTAPDAEDSGWSATAPTGYPFTSAGSKTLYAWAKDAAGIVSNGLRASVIIDTTAPTVTAFSLPATSNTTTVAIMAFTATDNIGVTGYLLTESSTAPGVADTRWSATAPSSYTFTTKGLKSLYAWVKDEAGNVSNHLRASVTVDTVAPTVTSFSLPAISNKLSVAITTFTATDNQGVTGYLVEESDAAPVANDTRWSATAPKSFTFTSAGAKTLYAWVKDLVGNVSASSLSASVTIDTTIPVVTAFSLPAAVNTSTVTITTLTATDNQEVAGYIVAESAITPGASDSRWSAIAPAGYTFTTDGSKTLYAWAKDAAGNVSANLSAPVTVDTTPPTVTAFSLPAIVNTFIVNITTLTATDNIGVTGYMVTESATAPGATDARWTTTVPASYTFTTVGTKTLYAWARDGVGNVSAGRSATVTIDMTPPDVTVGSKPANPTKLTNASFSLSAGEPGATFQCQLDSGNFLTCSSPATYSNLTEGSHTFNVKATDLAGNTGSAVSYNWQVDVTAPVATIGSKPANPTNLTTVSFSFTANEVGATFQCKLDMGIYSVCTSPMSYPNLTEGSHTFNVKATDLAGNTGTPASYTWQVDVTAPVATIDSKPANPGNMTMATFSFSANETGASFQCQLDSGSFLSCSSPAIYSNLTEGSHTFSVKAADPAGNTGATASYTWQVDVSAPVTSIGSKPANPANVATASFSFSASETGATLQCQLDSGNFLACASPATYSDLTEGGHTFNVKATDPAGNTGAAASYTWQIDVTAPVTTIGSKPGNPTNMAAASFSFSTSETGATFKCQLDNGGFVSCSSPASYTNLTEGSHSFSVKATDLAGNAGAAAGYTWQVDVTAPVTTIGSKPGNPTSLTTASFSFSSSDTAATFQCQLDSGSYATCSSPANYANLTEGSHTFNVKATDLAGNTGAPANYTWQIDMTAPVTIIGSKPGNPTNLTTASFSFSANESGPTFQCQLDNGGFVSCSSPANYANLTEGSHTFDVKATDLAGNTGAAASQAWQIDVASPSLSEFSVPSLSNLLTVPINRLIATDNTVVTGFMVNEVSTAPKVNDDGWSATPPASYTFTTDGVKTLYAWAKDAAGNVSGSLSAPVTVDSKAPTVDSFSLPTASNTLTVTIANFKSTDNLGVTGYLVTESSTKPSAGDTRWSDLVPASYTFTTTGTKTLYTWARDLVGNVSGSMSASVNIDTTAPTVTDFSLPPTSISLTVAITALKATDNQGVAGFLVTDSATVPGPNESGWSTTAPASYPFTTAGTKTLYAWAKDAAGNVSASLSATVTVDNTIGSISGRVTDASDKGVANVSVSAYGSGGSGTPGGSAVTDSNGNFSFFAAPGLFQVLFTPGDPGDYYLNQWYHDGEWITVMAGQAIDNIDAVLELGGKLSGTVTDTSAKALGNVGVWIFTPDGHQIQGVSTINDGSYEIRLAPGSYKSQFIAPADLGDYAIEWYNDKKSLAEADIVTIAVEETLTVDARLSLYQTLNISGRVTTPDGMGIVDVLINGLSGSPITDNDGFYTGTAKFVGTDWSGRVIPLKGDLICTPAYLDYNAINNDQTEQNYACTSSPKTLYDDFNSGVIDPDRWTNNELVREIRDGKLVSKVTAYGATTVNDLSFKNPAAINYMEAEVAVNEMEAIYDQADSTKKTVPLVQINGNFFNDGTGSVGSYLGEISGNVGIRLERGQLLAAWEVRRLLDSSNYTTIASDAFPIPLALGQAYKLSLQWNPEAKAFTFGVNNLTRFWTFSGAVSPANMPLKSLRTMAVITPPNGLARISATFDNVVAQDASGNVVASDDFSSALLDGSKWDTQEVVREIVDGKLVLKLRGLDKNQFFTNQLSFKYPEQVNEIGAKVSLQDLKNPDGVYALARLSGQFYNDTGDISSGFQGDFTANIGLNSNPGRPPSASWSVTRLNDKNAALWQWTTVASGSLPVALTLGEVYNLSIKWDGGGFTFRCNDYVAYYTPSVGTKFAPNIKIKRLYTQIFPPASPPAKYDAFISATFDDAWVDRALLASPAFKDFGRLAVGSPSKTQNFIISNRGNGDSELALNPISITGTGTNPSHFTVTKDDCSDKKLSSGSACSLEVATTVQSSGQKLADLLISTNDAQMPNLEIPLTLWGLRKGDLNGDDAVSLSDAILALKVLRGEHPSELRPDYVDSGTDVNGDNKIGLPEVIFILQKAADLRQ